MSDQDIADIKVPVAVRDRHREQKEALGLTWAEYLDGQAPDLGDVFGDGSIADALADLLAEEFDLREIETAAYEGSREGAREALSEVRR